VCVCVPVFQLDSLASYSAASGAKIKAFHSADRHQDFDDDDDDDDENAFALVSIA